MIQAHILQIQQITQTFLAKIFLVIYNICISIDINLSKTVADGLLHVTMWESWKNAVYWIWLVAKHSWMVVTVQNYDLLNKHQWNNYL